MKKLGSVVLCLLASTFASAQPDGGRVRVGEPVEHLVETAHPYIVEPRDAAAVVWSTELQHPGASYIAPHFSRFELAEGDFVLVRSPDGSQAHRYEGLGRAGLGLSAEGFYSSRIRGDRALVELYSRGESSGRYGFQIDQFIRGYDTPLIGESGYDPEAICGGDDAQWAKCFEGSEPEIYDRSRAVVRLLISGQFLCTGWLVGCEGHMMTNNHCIGNQSQASNTDYEFMAEGATCSTTCFGSLACPGTVEATSATMVKTSSAFDYALVKLPGNLSEDYGYMRLRESGPTVGERIYIPQHPAGWGKRVAALSSHPSDSAGFCEVLTLSSPACTGSSPAVGYYCDTQGGSSGSPVLGYDDHQVVGLHHCANCPNRAVNITNVISSVGDDMPNCALGQLAGEIELDQPTYTCSDTVSITLVDDSLQGQGSQQVTISSDSEGQPETVTLVPEAPGSGTFRGTISLAPPAAVPGDGVLAVTHDEGVTVSYTDVDDGMGGDNVVKQAQASVDCVAPQISGVGVASVSSSSATIVWQTDEPASSVVEFGTDSPSATVSVPAPVTDHVVVVPSLVECTEHVFLVRSDDGAGNTTTDDNGSILFSFETDCIPPQPIPDGSGLSRPLLLAKSPTQEIRVRWDDVCAPPLTHLIWGPLDQVPSYGLGGAVCSVSSPVVWETMPEEDIFFLLIGHDGFETESSWGQATTGERNGGLSSGLCDSVERSDSGSCGN